MEIVLASASPRRQELLRQVGVSFTVITSGVDEQMDPRLSPGELVEQLALSKAEDVARRHPDRVVLGADTVVVLGNQVLGKPRDRAGAISMLERLSGREHQVYTGVAVVGQGRRRVEHEVTDVRFRALTRSEVERYVDSGEPIDKAGAYAVQGLGAVLVSGVSGDYFSVVGLPICRTVRILSEFGVEVL